MVWVGSNGPVSGNEFHPEIQIDIFLLTTTVKQSERKIEIENRKSKTKNNTTVTHADMEQNNKK
jgi:hypothetical protein